MSTGRAPRDEAEERCILEASERLAGTLMSTIGKTAAKHGLTTVEYMAVLAMRTRLPEEWRDAPVEHVARAMRELGMLGGEDRGG